MRAMMLACLLAAPIPGQAAPRFTDVSGTSGIEFRNVCGEPAGKKGWLNETMGAGAAWLDFDGDGSLDLYLVNGSTHTRKPGTGEPNRLLRGDGSGKFTDVTERAGVGHRGWGYGVAAADFDNDGHTDLFVTNFGTNVLYRNRGDGTFADVTKAAGVAGPPVWSSSAAFFDMEGDGDLDLYVTHYMDTDVNEVPRRGSEGARTENCIYKGINVFCGPLGETPLQDQLFRNDGDGKFTDVTRAAGLFLDRPRCALGVVTADFDNDGDQDIYVANDSVANSLWRNRGNGTFEDIGLTSLAALNSDGRAQAGMGTDFGDFNGDGWLDIVVTNFAHDYNTLYRNLEGKFFIDDSTLGGMTVTHLALSWGAGFHDFDLDGDLDLFIANGHTYPQVDDHDLGTTFRQRNHLFVNNAGRFADVSSKSGPGLAVKRSFRGAAFADYDNDGDVDILVTTVDEAPVLLRNDTPREGARFLQVELRGTTSNRDAVGARLSLTTGDRRAIRERKGGGSYLSTSDRRVHFGIPAGATPALLEVRWPGGRVTRHEKPEAGTALRIVEPRGE